MSTREDNLPLTEWTMPPASTFEGISIHFLLKYYLYRTAVGPEAHTSQVASLCSAVSLADPGCRCPLLMLLLAATQTMLPSFSVPAVGDLPDFPEGP